ncbi:MULTISPECIES: Na+/H+ antiporter NhaA [unclassified Streptomyces]|uniref:Na+/H+ antiporter NhaA n=1 Tax=unclassified Streptomyces TaxID=2593676 RepID=UPI0002D52659|nr:Na+/H+ antiporter NhaA [Streptomyces sp. ACT-1]
MAAGVSLTGADGFWASTITWGVLAGLLAGKPLGIVGVTWLTARFASAHLNPRIAWADIAGVGILSAIGFQCLPTDRGTLLHHPGAPDRRQGGHPAGILPRLAAARRGPRAAQPTLRTPRPV